MGSEESIAVTHLGKRQNALALLETDEVIIRGEPRIRIPFRDIKSVDATDGVLTIVHAGGETSLSLGPKATKWAEKIRSPRSRLDKLGVKTGARAAIVGTVESAFIAELTARVGDVLDQRAKDLDLLFVAIDDKTTLKKLSSLKRLLAPAGALWTIRAKGGQGVSEAEVMAAGKAAGLVDTKVVRFSATHTAEKFVIPVKSR
jgi:hypothetical protein